jgi:ribonuclease Z
MAAASANGEVPAQNPYGGVPGGGITMPPYYKPTDSVSNTTNYYPATEELGKDEMRISFVGSNPFPPNKSQAGTSIMVELGNGKRFFFDFGPGCLKNIIAMQVPLQMVNDIFITHLHVDHYHDIPYLYCFAPWAARWKPLRVTGPSGRNPDDGTKHMIEGMKQMLHWHTDSFNSSPIGDGFEVEVNEFDFRDDYGVCYDEDGVTIRHWRRSHTKDGASAYRLDWNGLSFVWTGDGRPDELTLEHAKGVDVFVTEMQPDMTKLNEVKMGLPEIIGRNTIDTAHTVHYADGYLFNQIQPRLAMLTHMAYDEALIPEILAGIRLHYNGFFQFGAPDVVVVNVQKDAIWTRMAALSDAPNPARPSKEDAKYLFDLSPTHLEVDFPDPKHSIPDVQEEFVRDKELDKDLYYPADVNRDLVRVFPDGFKIEIPEMIKQKVGEKVGEVRDKVRGRLGRT